VCSRRCSSSGIDGQVESTLPDGQACACAATDDSNASHRRPSNLTRFDELPVMMHPYTADSVPSKRLLILPHRRAGGTVVLVIDAHQHAWDPVRAPYPWLGPELAPIDRAVEFDLLAPKLAVAGVDRTVMVQSSDSALDTAYMFEVARTYEQVAGIVGWVPLRQPEQADAELDRLSGDPLLVGVRHLIHEEPDPEWLLQQSVNDSLEMVSARGLTFDVVAVLPRHLEHVPTLAERHPDLRIVVDHLAKPPFGTPDLASWREALGRAAQYPNVHAKISGLYPLAGSKSPTGFDLGQLAEVIDHAVETFGADRLMYGGDWPISVLFGDYEKVWAALTTVLDRYDEPTRVAILGRTAARFYRLPAHRLPDGRPEAG